MDARRWIDAFKLWSRRRTQGLLSTLGITVGVSGLILVIAIGEGAGRELQNAVGALGSGSLILRAGDVEDERPVLTRQMAESVHRIAGDQLLASAPLRRAQITISAGEHTLEDARITGTDRHYPGFFDLDLHSGRFITDYDARHGTRVAVLGWEAGRSLFPRGQVIGQQLKLRGDWYTVIGWLKPGSRALPDIERLGIDSIDLEIYIPADSALFDLRGAALDELLLRFRDESALMGSLDLVQRVVELDGAESGVEFLIPIQLLRHKQRVQQLFQYLLFGLASLMLLVGGVGMMNIMLFNVLSRRPEIGLRRAIGATRRDIIAQFVTESMIVALAGGFGGILLGFASAVAIDLTTSWQLAFSAGAAVLGLAASLVIGGVFGAYPALQAAAVSPVQSLRQT